MSGLPGRRAVFARVDFFGAAAVAVVLRAAVARVGVSASALRKRFVAGASSRELLARVVLRFDAAFDLPPETDLVARESTALAFAVVLVAIISLLDDRAH